MMSIVSADSDTLLINIIMNYLERITAAKNVLTG